jgi:hypothetical protein
VRAVCVVIWGQRNKEVGVLDDLPARADFALWGVESRWIETTSAWLKLGAICRTSVSDRGGDDHKRGERHKGLGELHFKKKGRRCS